MFDVNPSIGLASAARSARLDAASNARVANHFESAYEEWRALAKRLQIENADLKLALNVEKATSEAFVVVIDAFKAQHPTSPLLVEEGKLNNGNPRRKTTSLWIAAFDAAARKLGITNPVAYRIS